MPARPLESKKPPRGGYPWAAMPVNEHLESIIIIPHETLESKGEILCRAKSKLGYAYQNSNISDYRPRQHKWASH